LTLISDQDSVRLLAVEGCAALGKLLEPQDCVAHILPVIVNFSQVNKCVNMIKKFYWWALWESCKADMYELLYLDFFRLWAG